VLGAGKTGIASSLFLLNKTKELLLSDSSKPDEEFKDKINKLAKSGVEIEFGGNSDLFINKSDLVVISPGISPQAEVVKKIKLLQIPIISDIELASYFISKPIIAITGTNGKTTTTSLITHIINKSGKKAVAVGNIGNPLIQAISKGLNSVDYYVLEISSFQIFYSPNLAVDIAVCLNITPDHLDWHGSFNHYVESKKRLFHQQKENSWAILNISNETLKELETKNNKFYFSPYEIDSKLRKVFPSYAFIENGFLYANENKIINKNELKIFGTHNIENALACIAVCKTIHMKNEDIKAGLNTFDGVEHRLEFVRTIKGKSFYNDSKATNPESTIKAIQAIKEKQNQTNGKNITLILGGRDKNTNLLEMIKIIKQDIWEVILYGEAKDRFETELRKDNFKDLKIVKDLNEAVEVSLQSNANMVLFSPACSSFDMFKNYEERGKYFKEILSKY